jgi:glycosyltransferase 2 family protein
MHTIEKRKIARLYISTILIFIAVMVAFFFATKFVDQDDLSLALKKIPLWMLPALLSLSLLNYFSRFIRWKLLLDGNRKKVTNKAAFLSYFSGFSMAATPGKSGEIVRLWLLERLDHVPYATSLSALIGDRVGDLLAVLILGSFAFEAVSRHSLALVVVVIFTAFLIVLWYRLDLLSSPLKIIYRCAGRFRRKIARAHYLLRTCRPELTYKKAGAIFCLSLFGWFAEGIGFYLLLHELGNHLDLTVAVSIFCLSVLLGAVSMLPGGIGSTEIVMITLLQATGCRTDISIVATGVMRIATLWFAIFIGLLVVPIALRMASKSK